MFSVPVKSEWLELKGGRDISCFSGSLRPPWPPMMLSPSIRSSLLQSYFPPLCTWQHSWIPAICARAPCVCLCVSAITCTHCDCGFEGGKREQLAASPDFSTVHRMKDGFRQKLPRCRAHQTSSLCLSYFPFFAGIHSLHFLHTLFPCVSLQGTPWWSWWRACPMEPWTPFWG